MIIFVIISILWIFCGVYTLTQIYSCENTVLNLTKGANKKDIFYVSIHNVLIIIAFPIYIHLLIQDLKE